MTKLDINALVSSMTDAAANSLKKNWSGIKVVAAPLIEKLAQNLTEIEKMKLAGTIDEARAKVLLTMQRNALKTILLTQKGVGIVAAESAMNAVVNSVKGTVNKIIGWDVL